MGLFNRKKQEEPKQEERSIIFNGLGYNGSSNYSNGLAMRISACYCAVNTISNSIGILPISVVKDNGSDRKVLYNHNLKKLLNGRPDLRHNHFNFFKYAMESVLLRGNFYAIIVRDDKLEVSQLIYVDSDFVQPVIQENGTVKYIVTGYSRLFDQDEILDFHLHLDESYRGISVIKYASRALQSAYEQDKTSLNFFKSGGNLAGIIKPQNPIQADQRKQIADAWRASFENTSDRVPVVVMPYGVDFQAVSITPEDAELIDTRKYSVEEIARFFGIHPYKLYAELSNKMSNEDIEINYLTDTIMPLAQMMKEEMENKLLRPSERGKIKIEFDFTAFFKTDKKSEAEYYRALINIGILSINEVRAALGYDPIEGEAGDAHWVQLSYASAEDVAQGKYIQTKTQGQDQKGDVTNDNKLMKDKEENKE